MEYPPHRIEGYAMSRWCVLCADGVEAHYDRYTPEDDDERADLIAGFERREAATVLSIRPL